MSHAEENAQILNLIQAMIGSISSNLRWVTLEVPKSDSVHLRFLFDRDDVDDREEIEDITFEFAALQIKDIDIDVDVIVDRRPISDLELPGRVVFGRKE